MIARCGRQSATVDFAAVAEPLGAHGERVDVVVDPAAYPALLDAIRG